MDNTLHHSAHSLRLRVRHPGLAVGALLAVACSTPAPSHEDRAAAGAASAPVEAGTVLTMRDTTVTTVVHADGIAEAIREATLSTKLMGTITEVAVRAGDPVRAGQLLVRVDARELLARSTQVAAGIAAAEAQQQEASAHATRLRALYRDSAASRVQLEAAETGLARADAGVRAARAASGEVDAMSSYATVRAPFSGLVTVRAVDPGALAAPGAPLVTIQDASQLRVVVTTDAAGVRTLTRGARVSARIDGTPVTATVEAIIPSGAGNLFAVHAVTENRGGRLRAGSAATLMLPQGTHAALVVPAAAVIREGDLTGVLVRLNGRDDRRWIRIGESVGAGVEVTAGLQAGEQVVVPITAATSTGAR